MVEQRTVGKNPWRVNCFWLNFVRMPGLNWNMLSVAQPTQMPEVIDLGDRVVRARAMLGPESLAKEIAQRFVQYRERIDEVTRQLVRYRAVADSCPLPMFVTDFDGRCLYVNKFYTELTGATLENAQYDGWKNFIHPDDRERVETAWTDACTSGALTHESTEQFLRPDGKVTSALVKATRLPCGGWVGYCVPLQFVSYVKWLAGAIDPIPTV